MRMTEQVCQVIGAARRKPSSGLKPFIVMTDQIHFTVCSEAWSNGQQTFNNFMGWPLHIVEDASMDDWLKAHWADLIDLCERYELFIFR